jgi:hypothetical protein
MIYFCLKDEFLITNTSNRNRYKGCRIPRD